MKMSLLTLLAVTGLVIALPQGQASSVCSQKEFKTQQGMNQCAAREYKAADKKLNQLYGLLKKNESKEQEAHLLKAQLAWIKFRNSECKYRANKYKGGSIVPLIYNQCMTELTTERNTHFTNALKDMKR